MRCKKYCDIMFHRFFIEMSSKEYCDKCEFEICEDAWDRGDCLVEIVWDDGSDLIGFKHCIVCGGEYNRNEM